MNARRTIMLVITGLLILIGAYLLFSLKATNDVMSANIRSGNQTQESVLRTVIPVTLTAAASPP